MNIPIDEDQLLQTLRRDQTTPFDLQAEPGWRVSVYHCAEYYVISIVMHHIISDGWSLDILGKELATFYSAAIRGEDPLSHVKPLPIQYCDYSVWQRKENQVNKHLPQLKEWVAELETSRQRSYFTTSPGQRRYPAKPMFKSLGLRARYIKICKTSASITR